ncbi:MAG: sodium:solute symporter family transporter [Desulfobacca sp.]|uniref:sodium:solute symporter family transporter n=1 Tax=Desulfobacca sp. TaxID=2067990 RepID=UPI00404A3176
MSPQTPWPRSSLTWPDYTVVLILLALLLLVGFWSGRREESTADFFLGNRRIPWWAAGLSFVATEISAVTLISVPAIAFMENWEYAQFFLGSFLARIVLALLFIPAFYRYQCTSIYEYLGQRFGAATQITGSLLFFITRLLASGVRLLVAAMAVSVLLGLPLAWSISLFTGISMVYISWGGIKAVIWTNVLQTVVFTTAGLAAIGLLLAAIDGGATAVLAVAGGAGKMTIFHWGPNPAAVGFGPFLMALATEPNLFVLATLNGLFGSLAAFGTDQEIMQRLLTVETRQISQKTMLLTPLGSGLVIFIFLYLGSCLYTFYAQHPELPLPTKGDEIFPHFIGQQMVAGWRGLMLAAVIMASIDSPLGSLTTSFVTDLYRPVFRPHGSDRHYLMISRLGVIIFGLLLAVIAYACSFGEKFLWLAFKIGGVTYGSLLGVFLLGLLSQRRGNRINAAAMILAAILMLALLLLSEKQILPLGWTWLLLLGTLLTFGVGWLGGESQKQENRQ